MPAPTYGELADIKPITDLIDAAAARGNLGSAITDTTKAPAETGWQIDQFFFQRAGQVCQIRIRFQRTGGTITVPVTGDIANQLISTLNVSIPAPVDAVSLTSSASGRVHVASLNSARQFYLAAVSPGANIATNDIFDVTGIYLTAASL